jgi:hypothetical protein
MLAYKPQGGFRGPLFVFMKLFLIMQLCAKMPAYKLQDDFSGPFLVFVNVFLIVVLGIRCLYTSFRAIFLLSLLMFKPVSHHAVVHQKLACKRRSGI